MPVAGAVTLIDTVELVDALCVTKLESDEVEESDRVAVSVGLDDDDFDAAPRVGDIDGEAVAV